MRMHAVWLPDTFVMALWAEQQVGCEVEGDWPPRDAARLPCPPHPAALPYDALAEQMPQHLELFEDRCVLLLPTLHELPLASVGPVPENAVFRPWVVPTAMSIADCFVAGLLEGSIAGLVEDGGGWSDDLIFWESVANFAQALVDQRAYVPGAAMVEGKYYPLWQAAFSAEAEVYWRSLRDCLPPVCRAVVTERPENKSSRLPDPALSFLDACVDHLVRQQRMRVYGKLVQKRQTSAPIYRQWLSALRAGQFSALDGSMQEQSQFAAEVAAWTEYLRPAAPEHPLKLVLELQPPERDDGPWPLQFALRSVKNPSLVLAAWQVWSVEQADAMDRHFPGAREALLAGLGVAREVFPPLQAALNEARPENCLLTKEQACDFMLSAAPLLRRLGLHVKLPEWWEGQEQEQGLRLRLVARTTATPARGALLGVSQLVDYRWELAMGKEVLTESDFQALANSKQPLLFHRGHWVRVDADALRQTLKFLDERGEEGQTTLAKTLQMGTALRSAGGLPISEFAFAGDGVEPFAGLEAGKDFSELPPPGDFIGQLRPYQVKGFSWMVFVSQLDFGVCLADDMGLGKTIQMISVLLYEKAIQRNDGPTLIVAPMSVVGNWVKEAQRFAPNLRVMVHHGQDRSDRETFLAALKQHDVVISTYNLVVRDLPTFVSVPWWNIVLDEAQNIKNPSTKQALAIRSLRARHRYCLTGTPVENRLSELWSLMDFLNPGYLGSLTFFRSYFALPIERDQDSARSGLLQRMIRPFILRRLKSDQSVIRDLPAKQENKVYCNLTSEQAALYQVVVAEMLEKLAASEGIERKGLVLSTLTKLKQITNHPVHFLRDGTEFSAMRSGKLQRLEEMLENVLAEDEKALIFTQFTELGDLLRKKLESTFSVEVLYLHGATPKARRDEMVTRFQREGGPPLFLLSLKAGGLGLNLTAATHVFHFDRWWNPAIEDQATDRAYRIGQTRNVQVHKYICVGTVEEKVDQMIEEKKSLANQIVTVGEAILTELSTDQLREIFTLSSDAVVE